MICYTFCCYIVISVLNWKIYRCMCRRFR